MAIAGRPEVLFCTFGDMLRVPGSREDLFAVRARGGDVRVVYSPLDALGLAAWHPDRQVVFLAVGFETTAPTAAALVLEADRRGLENVSLLVAHVRVPPAMEVILGAPGNRVQGFLAAGHVCTVMGDAEYQPLARRYGVAIVITGFEPVDLLEGIWRAVRQLERGAAEVENQYARSVRPGGNPSARAAVQEVFEVVDASWRGMGTIPASGLALRDKYRRFDARERFPMEADEDPAAPSECPAGLVLSGRLRRSGHVC
jgi:hydrogenase expression/formation protein HypD